MKMLILSPRLDVTGGVSNFTKILSMYLSFEYQLVFRGSPKKRILGPFGEVARFVGDYFSFFLKLFHNIFSYFLSWVAGLHSFLVGYLYFLYFSLVQAYLLILLRAFRHI
jgi:hypothetical protein